MKEVNSDNNIITTKSKIELKDYEFELIGQESESNYEAIDDNISESIPESNNNEQKEGNSTESKRNSNCFVAYFDYFFAIFLYLNSFIYFSYINLIHIIYVFYIIYTKYSTTYGCTMRIKGKIVFVFLILEFAYLILKIIISAIGNPNVEEIFKNVFPSNWVSIYEYVYESLVIILLIVYLILKDFSNQAFNNIELEKTRKILDS